MWLVVNITIFSNSVELTLGQIFHSAKSRIENSFFLVVVSTDADCVSFCTSCCKLELQSRNHKSEGFVVIFDMEIYT